MYNLGRIKEKIAAGKPVIGPCTLFKDPAITELFGYTGHDFVWIDAEHGALDRDDILQHIRAAHAAGAAAFVRVAETNPAIVKPILDMGPDGIVFPMIRSVEDAKLAVASCKYPPVGIRGFNPSRALRYANEDMGWYIQNADSNVWVILQIEHIDAVNCIEEILSVPGVDTIFVGPMDLSASAGILGQTSHPKMLEMYDLVSKAAHAHGIPLGVAVGSDPANLERWKDYGAAWVTVGQDMNMLADQSRAALAMALKKLG